MIQQMIVGLIVMGCGVYAAWTLMPAGARRSLASHALKLSLPEFVQKPLRRALKPAGACGGCDSCGDEKATKDAGVKTIRIHRMVKR
jgi:hypothetical protein